MRDKSKTNRDMPPRMLRRIRARKNGKLWISYYYNGRDETGKRREIPLGPDLNEARLEWARLERKTLPKSVCLMKEVFSRYSDSIIPGKKKRTREDNTREMVRLQAAFGDAPIDSISTAVVAQYRDARTAKVRANREIALLSHVFTIAREWGLTDKANPCFGLRRNKEAPRDYYANEAVWNAAYAEALQELKDAMDLAYLTGQRPADTLKAATTDVANGFFSVKQGKTEKRLRIRLSIDGEMTGLGVFVEDLLERRRLSGIRGSMLITNKSGLRMSMAMMNNRWVEARERAASKAALSGDAELGVLIRRFQFRDIRPKAASEIEDISHASRLLGHSKEKTTRDIYRRVGEVVSPTK
jgi:integrase